MGVSLYIKSQYSDYKSFRNIFFFFRDKATFEAFSTDLNSFITWLKKRYPEDAEMLTHIDLLQDKYKHLPVDVFTKEIRRTISKTSATEEVKKALRHSCSTDRRIFGECEIDMSSDDACTNI